MMKAQDRLTAAYHAAWRGEYARALNEYQWFHAHALEESPSLHGVRLSFALAYWKELADVYPPALQALQTLRDDKTEKLMRGDGNRELFNDVAALNNYLGQASQTALVFSLLDAKYQALAKQCAQQALQPLAHAHQYALALRYLPEDLLQYIRSKAKDVNADVQKIAAHGHSRSLRYHAYIHNYVADIQTILSILCGCQRIEPACACYQTAVDSLGREFVRKAVAQRLRKPTK